MGASAEGRSTVTLQEVARRAGVHAGTASRALNPATQGLVSEATLRKVQHAARALNYRPNPMAQGLKTNRSMMIGIVIPDLTNPLFPPIVRGADFELARAGYTTLIADTDNDPARERDSFEALQTRQVDGLIVASARRDDDTIQATHRAGIPLVLINRRDEHTQLPVVLGDDGHGIELAMRHLFDLGHRRIGHIAGPSSISTGALRARAFRQWMFELGGELDDTFNGEVNTYSIEEGARVAHEILGRARPTAILAGNDQIAVGVLDALRERRLRCPEDVSVVGYNDMPLMDKLSPAVTTVRVPHAEIGAEAARLLIRRLETKADDARTVSLPVQLVVRDSTGPVPVS